MDHTEDDRLLRVSLEIDSAVLVGSADVLTARYRYSLTGPRRTSLTRQLAPHIAPLRQARSSGDLAALERRCRQIAVLPLPSRPAGAVAALAQAVEQLREELDAVDRGWSTER